MLAVGITAAQSHFWGLYHSQPATFFGAVVALVFTGAIPFNPIFGKVGAQTGLLVGALYWRGGWRADRSVFREAVRIANVSLLLKITGQTPLASQAPLVVPAKLRKNYTKKP